MDISSQCRAMSQATCSTSGRDARQPMHSGLRGIAKALPARSSLKTSASVGASTPATAPAASNTTAQPAPKSAPTQNAPTAPRYRYSKEYGVPMIYNQVDYNTLLRDIRTEKVQELAFFLVTETERPTGSCLVVYKDGTLAQGFVPSYDFRIQYALEHHGVFCYSMTPEPTAQALATDAPIPEWVNNLIQIAPVAAVGLTYLGVRWALRQKGDMEDREKLRAKAAAERKMAKVQQQLDKLASEAERMASMGLSMEEIQKNLDALDVPYDKDELAVTVAKAQQAAAAAAGGPVESFNTDADKQREARREYQERLAEAEAEMAAAEQRQRGEMSQADAEQMLQLKTMKITMGSSKAKRNEAMARKVREAQRRLKGVKLQHTGNDDAVGFDDVAGIGEAKLELMEVVDFFTKPELFRNSGSAIPKGVLLVGPPGTGKTLLARAVAGEAGVAFLSLNASEFVEMFAGVGAARVRDLFKQARELAPSIIFIDEIDAVGRARGGDQGNDERDNTLNMMLSEMDGFDERSSVIVMAATNRRDILDPALIRPGRFDRTVYVGLPDFNGRIEVLNVHMAKHAVEPLTTEQLHSIAFETQRFSGAQLANLVNLASMFAAREGRAAVQYDDFFKALVWERLGPERPPYSGDRQRRLAVQEAATSLLCTLLPAIEPVQMVTIIPREKYPLGHTVVDINEGRELNKLFTRTYLEQQLLTTLAGRAAEELVYGTEGMSSLNQRRLILARRIVQKLAVSNAMTDNAVIGTRVVSQPGRMVGRTLYQTMSEWITPPTFEAADAELDRLLNESYTKAKTILQRNRAALDALIEMLLEKNTVRGDEVRQVVERLGDANDLAIRNAQRSEFL